MHFNTQSENTERGISLNVAAIEVGFGDTKWAYRDANNTIVRKSFPSLAPKHIKDALSTSMGTSARNTFIIDIEGEKFEVGPDVNLVVGQTNGGTFLSDEFPISKNYKALVYGAITQMTANHIGHLVLGLPVHTLDRFSNELKRIFTGTFKLRDRTVTIQKVSVLAQPVGTLVRCKAENMNIGNGINHLIIDPGYYSTDWVVANGFRVVADRSGGKVSGVSPILRNICNLISDDMNLRFDQVERVNNAIRHSTNLSIMGRSFTVADLWDYVHKSEPIVNDCINQIISKVGSLTDIESVILSGGGSTYYSKICKSRFSPLTINTLTNPEYANVVGFLLAGENSTAKLQ